MSYAAQEKYVDEYKDTISKFILDTVSNKRVIWNGLYLTELKEHVKVIHCNTLLKKIEIE